MQTRDIARNSRPVVLLPLTAVLSAGMQTCLGEEALDVEFLDLVIDVDVIWVENLGIVQRLEDGCDKGIGEEGIFLGRLETSDLAV